MNMLHRTVAPASATCIVYEAVLEAITVYEDGTARRREVARLTGERSSIGPALSGLGRSIEDGNWLAGYDPGTPYRRDLNQSDRPDHVAAAVDGVAA